MTKYVIFKWEIGYNLDDLIKDSRDWDPSLTDEEALAEALERAEGYAEEDMGVGGLLRIIEDVPEE